MLNNIKSHAKKIGMAPGTLINVETPKSEITKIQLIKYNVFSADKKDIDDINKLNTFINGENNYWVKIQGSPDSEVMNEIGEIFNINPLTLEDIMHNFFNAKIEFFENYIFIILQYTEFNSKTNHINSDQISMIIGSNFLISFEETQGDTLTPIENRIFNNSLFRKHKTDYLGYTILDLLVDLQYETIKNIAEKIENIEDQIINNYNPKMIHKINSLKKVILYFRNYTRSIKNLISSFEKEETTLINPYLKVYLRDVRDHIIQLSDFTEICRENIAHLIDLHLSIANNKMSEVMKVLTIIATIFIPLTFIAGIYGMNFKYMPELDWHYGYFTVLGFMFSLFIGSLVFFKYKKWI